MLVLKRRKISLNALAFSPDGTRLAVGGDRGFVQLWDLPGNKLEREIVTGRYANLAVFLTDLALLALHEERLDAYDPGSGELLGQVPRNVRRPARKAALRPGGASVAIAFPWAIAEFGVLGGLKTWETKRDDFRARATSLAYSGDGKRLAAGTGDGTVVLIDATTGDVGGPPLTTPSTSEVKGVALSPDGRSLACCAGTGLYLWRISPVEQIAYHNLGKTHFLAVAWHPSGDFFATANGDGKIDFWSAATGERRESFDWGVGKLHDVSFDATGDRAACCSKFGDVVIWDIDR